MLRMATEVKNRVRGSYSVSDAEAFTGMKQQSWASVPFRWSDQISSCYSLVRKRDIAPGWNPSLFVARMQHLIA
jgi:hypothetical protein